MGVAASVHQEVAANPTNANNILLKNNDCRKAFAEFIIEESLKMGPDDETILKIISKITEKAQSDDKAWIFSKNNGYSIPEELEVVDLEESGSMTSAESTQNQLFVLMLIGVFPRFLASSYYQKWAEKELDKNVEQMSIQAGRL